MKKDQDKSYSKALFISIFFHAVIIGGLLIGADFTKSEMKTFGESIDAVVINPDLVREQANRVREQREDAKRQERERLKRVEREAARLELQREKEEEELRQLRKEKLAADKAAREAEISRKKLAEEKRKAEKAAEFAKKKAKEAEAERKRELAAKKKAEEEAKKAKAKRQQELEKQRLAEKAAKQAEIAKKAAELEAAKAQKRKEELQRQQAEQEAALGDLFTGLESETEMRNTARGKQIQNEIQRWASRYVSLIQSNWIVNSSSGDLRCRLRLQLASDGVVYNVETLSGSEVLCRSAKASVFKIDKFPMPSDSEVAEKLRNIDLIFEH